MNLLARLGVRFCAANALTGPMQRGRETRVSVAMGRDRRAKLRSMPAEELVQRLVEELSAASADGLRPVPDRPPGSFRNSGSMWDGLQPVLPSPDQTSSASLGIVICASCFC